MGNVFTGKSNSGEKVAQCFNCYYSCLSNCNNKLIRHERKIMELIVKFPHDDEINCFCCGCNAFNCDFSGKDVFITSFKPL